ARRSVWMLENENFLLSRVLEDFDPRKLFQQDAQQHATLSFSPQRMIPFAGNITHAMGSFRIKNVLSWNPERYCHPRFLFACSVTDVATDGFPGCELLRGVPQYDKKGLRQALPVSEVGSWDSNGIERRSAGSTCSLYL